jgi:endonuclease YncB( thermonuclease family)
MVRILTALLIFASLFTGRPAAAQDSPDFNVFAQPDTVIVAQVIDPLRLRLTDGRIVQLSGIELPDLDPYEPGAFAVAATEALRPLLENRQVQLYQTKTKQKGRVNRMGYQLGHITVPGENGPVWIQGFLLDEGFARARPDASNPELADAMRAHENAARRARAGLWASEQYGVRTPETAGTLTGRFGIVEGTIRAAAINNNTVYLNFGPDWKTDFTIGLDMAAQRKLAQSGRDPLQLAGQAVRVRGWVENYNGPFIRLDDLSKLEFIQQAGE